MKQLRYLFEAFFVYLFFGLCKILPVDWASAMGGFIAHSVGPHLAKSRKALRNITLAFPDNTASQNKLILKDCWDNLGRTLCEYPHLKKIAAERVSVKNAKEFKRHLTSGEARIFISGHIANWELMTAHAIEHFNQPVDITYRAPNNPYVRNLLEKTRSMGGQLKSHPKDSRSARTLLKGLKNNEQIGIMIDQKYNEGVETSFFGRTAMSNPIFATLGTKHDVPIIPIQIIRTKGCNFTITAHEPLNTAHDVDTLTQDGATLIEKWITENPGQWIWLHNRWKETKKENTA